MRRFGEAILVVLLLLPVILLAAVGGWAMWQTGALKWAWLILPGCWGTAYLLSRWWRSDLLLLPASRPQSAPHWTGQDEQALELVEARQRRVKDLPPKNLTDPQFFLHEAIELALEIARFYHPQARDPLAALTVPEILAATELACEDCQQWMRHYVPGGHLLTVDQWRKLAKAPGWMKSVSDLSWALSLLVRATNIGRYAVSRLVLDPARRRMQANILVAFYLFFVRQVGFYAIEMNSGRLRGGAARYRELRRHLDEDAASAAADPSSKGAARDDAVADGPRRAVTVALVGQVNAGKSSLINALLGDRQAKTDVLPSTNHVQRYRLSSPMGELILLDTPGYGAGGSSDEQRQEALAALSQADLVLLVMNVVHPAREADVTTLEQLSAEMQRSARLRRPPLLAVLTHADLLSPINEWEPPYDWQQPSRAKEQTMAEAIEYHRALLGSLVVDAIVVVADVAHQRVYGVEQWLLPAMAALLDEARACHLIRALHREFDEQKVRAVFRQLSNAGAVLLKSSLGRA